MIARLCGSEAVSSLPVMDEQIVFVQTHPRPCTTSRPPSAAPGKTASLSGCRRDVAVYAEQVVRVVFGLDAPEPLEVASVRVRGSSVVVLRHLEVDVVPAGGEWPDSLPGLTHPRHVRIARSVWWPGSVESADESSIAVADRPVVFLVFVQRAGEVEDDRLGERRP